MGEPDARECVCTVHSVFMLLFAYVKQGFIQGWRGEGKEGMFPPPLLLISNLFYRMLWRGGKNFFPACIITVYTLHLIKDQFMYFGFF